MDQGKLHRKKGRDVKIRVLLIGKSCNMYLEVLRGADVLSYDYYERHHLVRARGSRVG